MATGRIVVFKRRMRIQPLDVLMFKSGVPMNLTISGHHLDVSPALRAYVLSKLERVLRHFDQIIEVKVWLSVDNQSEKDQRQQAICSLRVKGNDLHVASRHADLYAAVDTLADKLDRKVVSYKSRVKGWRSQPWKRVESGLVIA